MNKTSYYSWSVKFLTCYTYPNFLTPTSNLFIITYSCTYLCNNVKYINIYFYQVFSIVLLMQASSSFKVSHNKGKRSILYVNYFSWDFCVRMKKVIVVDLREKDRGWKFINWVKRLKMHLWVINAKIVPCLTAASCSPNKINNHNCGKLVYELKSQYIPLDIV